MIRFKTDGGIVVGLQFDGVRIERLVVLDVDKADIALRIVNAYNATEGLADDTLQKMADGGTRAGDIPERIVAWSMFWQASMHRASEFLTKARKHINSQPGGKI